MKQKIILLIALISSVLSACDNFLEIQPKTHLISTRFFKTQDDFEKAVNGAYAPLRDLYKNAWIMGEMHSDNAYYIHNPNNRGNPDPELVANFIEYPAGWPASSRYSADYNIIGRANQVLAQIENIEFSATIKKNLKGQALFLRALSYFDLVQYFGKIPLHLVPATSLSDVALPLSDVSKIYEQILSDATAAADLLPKKSQQEAGRATSGAAKTLLGNVHLVLTNYPAAETVLKEVVNSKEYQLLPRYADIFNPANKNSLESVFEVQYLEGKQGFASSFAYEFFPKNISAKEIVALMGKYGVFPANATARVGQAFNTPTPDIIQAYEEGDQRKEASVGYGIAHDVSYPFILKYLHPPSNNGITNDNWPVYRYSEVLLLLAEALDKNGKSAEALPYLNEVRTRTGLRNVASTAHLADVILRERRTELAFENKRWLDLVRTGKASEAIAAYGRRIKENPKNYYFPDGIKPPAAAFADIKTTFPLPADEALLSPHF